MMLKICNYKIDITNELLFSLQKEQLNFLPWQNRWYQNRFLENRSLKKARQIGADYYFLFEALQDACLTGRNKIFIGNIPIEYLLKHAGIKEFKAARTYIFNLSNGANIYVLNHEYFNDIPLGGIYGDVYISEWSWIENLRDVVSLAGAFSAHDKWRVTIYTYRSKFDVSSRRGNSILCDSLLGRNYYYDLVQNSEYELGSLFLINHQKLNDWELMFTNQIAQEMIFCCSNDN